MKKNNFDKILNIYSYILIFFVFMGPTFGKFKINGIDFNIARVLLLFMVILLMIKFVIVKKEFKIKSKELKYVISFYILWAIYSVITGLWCKDIKMYIIKNFYVITGIASILFFTFCVDIKENMKYYFYIMQIGILISSVYYFFIKKTYIAGFYHNTNDLATAIVFLFPITVYLLYNAKNIFSIMYQFIVCLMYYYAFILINSRACSLGIQLGAILSIALVSIKNKDVILKNDRLKMIAITLLILLSVIGINEVTKKVGTISSVPIEKTDSSGNRIEVSTSNEERINLIYNTLEFLKNDYNWLHGIGTGNSIYYMQNYAKYSTGKIYSLHNYWLDIFLCFGGAIGIGYVIAYVLLCKNLLKRIEIKQSFAELLKNKNFIFLFFLLSFILSSISSSTILTREWMWIAFALIISYITLKEKEET